MPSPEDFTDEDWLSIQAKFVDDLLQKLLAEVGKDFVALGRFAGYCMTMLSAYADEVTDPVDYGIKLDLDIPINQDDNLRWLGILAKVREFCEGDQAYMAYILSKIAERLNTTILGCARIPWSEKSPGRCRPPNYILVGT